MHPHKILHTGPLTAALKSITQEDPAICFALLNTNWNFHNCSFPTVTLSVKNITALVRIFLSLSPWLPASPADILGSSATTQGTTVVRRSCLGRGGHRAKDGRADPPPTHLPPTSHPQHLCPALFRLAPAESKPSVTANDDNKICQRRKGGGYSFDHKLWGTSKIHTCSATVHSLHLSVIH